MILINKIFITTLVVLSTRTLYSQNLKCSQNNETIVSIAKAKLVEIGGECFLRDDYIFEVTKKKDLWYVTGSHNGKPIIKDGKKGYYAGRSGCVTINSKTCEVLQCPLVDGAYKVNKISVKDHKKILFNSGESELTLEVCKSLDKITSIMKDFRDTKYNVEGHSDNEGNTADNLKLSQKRAQIVVDYLVSHGINKSRLQAIGYGESKPIATNNSSSGKAKNRRVVLTSTVK